MNTIIIAILIFLDIIPGSVPFVSDVKKSLGNKIEVEERTGFWTSQNDAPKNEPLVFSPLPNKTDKSYELTVGADTYEAIDMGTGEIMLEKDKNKKVQIASLTKLMAARLLLKDGDLEKIAIVNDLSKMRTNDSRMWLAVGDKVTYRTLLHGMLINSASDAALTVANNLYSGGYDEFIEKMNEEADKMNFRNTHFNNPVGWDDKDNYSSANDLQVLARTLLKNDIFRKIVATNSETVYSEQGRPYYLTNTNILLDGTTVFGVKTGTTAGARQCLIALTKTEGQEVLYIILGSDNRFSEAQNLLKWTDSVYNW
jgi:D-alanyl-D-alanine carboxypeptidase